MAMTNIQSGHMVAISLLQDYEVDRGDCSLTLAAQQVFVAHSL